MENEIYGFSWSGFFGVTFKVVYSCAHSVLQKPTGCTEFWLYTTTMCRCGARYSFIYSSPLSFLLLVFFWPRCAFLLCPLSPFIFRLRNQQTWTILVLSPAQSDSTFLVPLMFKQQPNTPIRCVFWTLSFYIFFSDNQRETKSHLRGQLNKWWSPPPHTMITQNVLTSFDVYAFSFMLALKCPFFFFSSIDVFLVFFISGSLKKFIGSFTFFSLLRWTNNATLSFGMPPFYIQQRRDKFHYAGISFNENKLKSTRIRRHTGTGLTSHSNYTYLDALFCISTNGELTMPNLAWWEFSESMKLHCIETSYCNCFDKMENWLYDFGKLEAPIKFGK